MIRYREKDLDFATEYNAALSKGPPRLSVVFLGAIAGLFISFLVWANWAQLDEVTRGEGRVVTAGKNQLVQSVEGGIVKELLVHPGHIVSQGDVLLRIDDTRFSASLGEFKAKQVNLRAELIRLAHEVSIDAKGIPIFPAELRNEAPEAVAQQLELFNARKRSLGSQLQVLEERVEQRLREIKELELNVERLSETLSLAHEEERIKAPLAKSGVVPKTELIRLRREISNLSGQLNIAKESQPRIEASIREARALLQQHMDDFRHRAQDERSTKQAELSIVEESIRSAEDRVLRTVVRAPADGIIYKLNVNTVGGVIQAGETLAEIVSQRAPLLIEANIKPSDIAFVHLNQRTFVKISAYDFSIYGGLEGIVERISADSIIDQKSGEVFYLVTIKTLSNGLTASSKDLVIFPGMVASVDIITGKKSVLEYLLKPIIKARYAAMRER